MTPRPSRKLAVILHADVVGSTTLVQIDETLAHERIQDAFCRFSAAIEAYGGVSQELRGDAIVAKFGRASDAVMAAIAFQAENAEFIATLKDEIHPRLRVGIAIGEVVFADNTVTGSGVVLAQRLEQLADPGGVCIQGAARETVPQRFPFQYGNIGKQKVKGFNDPVSAFTVTITEGKSIPPPEPGAQAASSTIALSDKPSIAILPFANMSGDSEQEYFSDGITEDIITALTKFRSLSVIARNSTFAYKGRALRVQEIADDLGVHYVVEGSVRKSGHRVRITAQLVEAITGSHIWAQRYDRQLDDIFAVQDDVSQAIVATIAGRLDEAAAQRARHKPPDNMTAYDFFLRGLQQYNTHDRKPLAEARRYFRKAIELDENYARAHAYLALTIFTQAFYVYTGAGDLEEALAIAQKAVALDSDEPVAHAAVGLVMFMQRHDSGGIANLEKSISLNPHDPELAHWLGFILTYFGEPDKGTDWLRAALHLNPHHGNCHTALGIALYLARNYDEAIEVLSRQPGEERWSLCYLAAASAQLGRSDDAKSAARRFVENMQAELRERGEPLPANDIELAHMETAFFRRSSDAEHLLDGLRKAGL